MQIDQFSLLWHPTTYPDLSYNVMKGPSFSNVCHRTLVLWIMNEDRIELPLVRPEWLCMLTTCSGASCKIRRSGAGAG